MTPTTSEVRAETRDGCEIVPGRMYWRLDHWGRRVEPVSVQGLAKGPSHYDTVQCVCGQSLVRPEELYLSREEALDAYRETLRDDERRLCQELEAVRRQLAECGPLERREE